SPQLLAELVPKLLLVLANGLDTATFQPADGRCQSDKSGHIVIARFKLVGNRFGLSILVALGAGATLSDALDLPFDSISNIEKPSAKRSQETLVSWRRQQID